MGSQPVAGLRFPDQAAVVAEVAADLVDRWRGICGGIFGGEHVDAGDDLAAVGSVAVEDLVVVSDVLENFGRDAVELSYGEVVSQDGRLGWAGDQDDTGDPDEFHFISPCWLLLRRLGEGWLCGQWLWCESSGFVGFENQLTGLCSNNIA